MTFILPKSDDCFKELFRSEDVRKYFISDVTGIPLKDIKSIRLANPLLRKNYKRQLFYLSKLYAADIKDEEDYDKLTPCISIAILDFKLSDRPEYHNIYKLRDKDGHVFSDLF